MAGDATNDIEVGLGRRTDHRDRNTRLLETPPDLVIAGYAHRCTLRARERGAVPTERVVFIPRSCQHKRGTLCQHCPCGPRVPDRALPSVLRDQDVVSDEWAVLVGH